jgi:hypothetical protein
VLHPYLTASGHDAPHPTLVDFVSDENDSSEDARGVFADQVTQSLASGDFALVVAAPHIPVGVQRVLEYLNARGQRLYGLEVSYFRGPVECFVPRLVVKPLVSDPAGRGTDVTTFDLATFLPTVPEGVRDEVAALLSDCRDAGAEILWRAYGPSVTVRRGKRRQIAYLESNRLGITLKATADFPQGPFDAARAQLAQIGAGYETKDDWYRLLVLSDTDSERVGQAMEVVRGLVASLGSTR